MVAISYMLDWPPAPVSLGGSVAPEGSETGRPPNGPPALGTPIPDSFLCMETREKGSKGGLDPAPPVAPKGNRRPEAADPLMSEGGGGRE